MRRDEQFNLCVPGNVSSVPVGTLMVSYSGFALYYFSTDVTEINHSTNLGFACALQDVDQRARHLLLVLDANPGLEHRAQQHVVVGGVLGELLVHLHGKDVHALVARLDPDHGPGRLAFGRVGRADLVPLLHELPPGDGGHRDVDQSDVVVLVLLLLLVRVLVEVGRDVLDGGQVVELKVLPPEDVVGLELAGGAGVQRVVQAQLAEVFLFGWQVLGLDDPQLQQVFHPATVVLETNITGACLVMCLETFEREKKNCLNKLYVYLVSCFSDLATETKG